MKRSELNKNIREAIEFVENRGLCFPEFAKWGPEDWKILSEDQREIVDNMLGWDVSDFGGEFEKTGLLIFTFRNGNFHQKDKYPKPYAEKLLLVGDGQTLPYHFHWSKMEDIINRGGGDLEITVYNANEKEDFADTEVHLSMDGKKVTVPAGGKILLQPGQSVTLMPGQYHQWIGVPGTGPVMLFEVSTTNDDTLDNRFYSAKSRLPQIEEDEPAEFLIFIDYKNYVNL